MSEVQRIAIELERTIDELGQDVWAREPEWCRARVAEFYDGPTEPLVVNAAGGDELPGAHGWLLFDCPLPDGETPLWHLQQDRTDRAVELLARSEVRAWRIESAASSPPIAALCPRGGGRARLEIPRARVDDLAPGAFAVARSVPLGPAWWLLLGGVAVVDPDAAGEFARLVASLEAPPGEFWRVHGGVLARAASEWRRGALRRAA